MKILVTGGAGYLGSVLIPKLLVRGHEVRVLDIGYFGVGHLRLLRPGIELVREDLRRVPMDEEFCEQLLDGCDCIIHLAAISNDPSAELNPDLTNEVNLSAAVALAEIAKNRGIQFLFSSSCSAYGEAEGLSDEDCALRPLTTYAVSKVRAEEALLEMAGESWSPVILRNGTLYGYSPRMRFDLVVNIFSLYSCLRNEIRIFGDGLQWRPFLHVKDCARAFIFLAEKSDLSHSVYNISGENLRVVDVAELFRRISPRLEVVHVEVKDPDLRNYRVTDDRIREEGFAPRASVEEGAEEMIEAIVSGLVADPESIYYRNAKWINELMHIGERSHRDLVGLIETIGHR